MLLVLLLVFAHFTSQTVVDALGGKKALPNYNNIVCRCQLAELCIKFWDGTSVVLEHIQCRSGIRSLVKVFIGVFFWASTAANLKLLHQLKLLHPLEIVLICLCLGIKFVHYSKAQQLVVNIFRLKNPTWSFVWIYDQSWFLCSIVTKSHKWACMH